MLNLLKSDFFRIVKGKMFWGYSIVCVASVFAFAAMLAWFCTPEFAQMVNDGVEQQQALNSKVMASITSNWAECILDSSVLGIIGSCFIGIFLISDIKSGFIKNLSFDRKGRRRYFAEKLILVGIMQAFFVILLALATTGAFAVYGFTYETANTPSEIALWLLGAWLIATAYGCITACICWAVRTEWSAVASALCVSSGIAGVLIIRLTSMLSTAFPVLSGAHNWMLAGCIATMREGAVGLLTPNANLPIPALLPLGQTILVPLLYIAVCVIITFAVLQKRDVR